MFSTFFIPRCFFGVIYVYENNAWKIKKIPLDKSHNVKIIEGGFYKVLLACIKVTTGKEFHMVQAAWNVKASKRGFHKLQATCNVKKAEAGNRKRKATYIEKKNRRIWKGTSQMIELKVTKNVVGNGFLKIFSLWHGFSIYLKA